MMMYRVWLMTPHQRRLPTSAVQICNVECAICHPVRAISTAIMLASLISHFHPYDEELTTAPKNYNHYEHVSNLCPRTGFFHLLRYPSAFPSN